MRRLTPNPDHLLDDVLKWAAGAPLRVTHTEETKAKMRASKKRRDQAPHQARIARQKAEWLAARRKWHRRHFPPLGTRAIDRIVSTMDPACWYARPDIVNLSGVERKQAGNTLLAMVHNGFAERRDCPGYVPARFSMAPRFVYRLTAKGVALGELIRGMG